MEGQGRTAFDRERTLSLDLVGTTANRDAIGARVELRDGERLLVREVRAGDGYLGQSTTSLLFGVLSEPGAEGAAAHLQVVWPGGDVETIVANTGRSPM